jgi:hypothetical protein
MNRRKADKNKISCFDELYTLTEAQKMNASKKIQTKKLKQQQKKKKTDHAHKSLQEIVKISSTIMNLERASIYFPYLKLTIRIQFLQTRTHTYKYLRKKIIRKQNYTLHTKKRNAHITAN